ncbi:DUF3168 domain-containing protein [Pacificimonas sp. WHA3]|uniref:DUF3168 domain-containing protein n=1 Tax=Pacificimonas pallii TaxID=2827236 RepID=A0ABS6SB98_9SPHN|nr:DUF3168 domain-containing protein [Pacificimonas pallii]MBV7255206.1 DUF3168 domain-containing protein [Pacificimonas pallii]
MIGGYELQVAVRRALSESAALTDWTVVDGPTANETAPYISIGPDLILEAGGKAAALRRHRFTVTLWARGSAVSPVKAAMAAAESAVLGLSADLGLARVVALRFLRGFTRRAPNDGMLRGELEFEALLEPTEAIN